MKELNHLAVRKTPNSDHEAYVAAMWLMFLRAPGRDTAPGEPVDLGEIGEVREKQWTRPTPYSVVEPTQPAKSEVRISGIKPVNETPHIAFVNDF